MQVFISAPSTYQAIDVCDYVVILMYIIPTFS